MPLADQLAAARSAADEQHYDVDLYFGTTLSADLDNIAEQKAAIAQQVEAAVKNPDRRLGQGSGIRDLQNQIEELDQRAAELKQQASGNLTLLRFWRLPGDAYATLMAKHPPRLDVPLDLDAEYNTDEVAKAAATYAAEDRFYGAEVAPDGTTTPLTPDIVADLWKIASGRDVDRIRRTILILNDYAPRYEINAAKKARADIATRSE